MIIEAKRFQKLGFETAHFLHFQIMKGIYLWEFKVKITELDSELICKQNIDKEVVTITFIIKKHLSSETNRTTNS